MPFSPVGFRDFLMTAKASNDNYGTVSDEELVQLSLKDVDCFYHLMKRYEPKILRYINRISDVNQEETKDILQEIFIKIYRNLNGFNQKLKFSSWIYRIAHNEIINQYYKKKSHSGMVSLNAEDDETNSLSRLFRDEDIHDNYVSRETAERVRKALVELPIKYREVIILRYLEDKGYKEISDILHRPPGTIAALLNRARLKFKKIAQRHQLEGLT